MAMTQIVMPAEHADDWTDFIDIVGDVLIGHIGVSLSEYDTTSAPVVKAGSKVEVGGSYFRAATDQTPSGSPTSGAINYITVSSAGAVSWSAVAPAWDDTKQGFYSGTSRYIAGCYYDATGPTYYAKWVWTEPRADFLQDRYTANLRYGIKTIHWSAWNMNSTATLGVTFGLGSTIAGIEPLFVTARIHDSDVAYYYPVPYFVGGTIDAWIQGWNSSGCTLERRTSGFFDSVDYETALGDVTVIYPLKVI